MKKIIIGLVTLAILVGGCSLSIGKKKVSNLGVYKSTDYAETWEHKVFAGLTTKNKQVKIDGINITRLHMNPNDSNIIYLCTSGKGIYKTEDSGELWKKTGLADGTYVNLAIDKETPEILYAASKSKILKSVDSGDNWETIYVEIKEGEELTDIAVDHYDSKIVYATTSKGALLKSSDYGVTWRVVHRFDYSILRIYIDPLNSRNIYLITLARGLYISRDKGSTWTHVYDKLKEINKKTLRINSFSFYKANPKIIYMATDYGIIKTTDGGETYGLIKTLIKEGIPIDNVAVDPEDSERLYLIKGNKLHKSENGGSDWKTIQLPSPYSVSEVLFDFNDSSIIYLGIIK